MKNLIAIAALALLVLPGCATVSSMARNTCEFALGGSKLGERCAQIEKSKADAVEEAVPATQ